MKDGNKTKDQLIKELNQLRRRFTEFETLETQCKRAGETLRENASQEDYLEGAKREKT